MQRLSRRNVLAKLGLVAGGIAGASAAAPLAAASATPLVAPQGSRDNAANQRRSGSASFTLQARGLSGLGQRPGPRTQAPGDQVVSSARLVDAAGSEVGTFHSTSVVLNPTTRFARPTAAMEHHIFELADGLLVGSGAAGHPGQQGNFAVTGGTGRYSGARGSYSAVQSPYHLGGDGCATFHFALRTEE